MSVYLFSGTAADVASALERGKLVGQLADEFRNQVGYRPGESEQKSWANSLAALSGQLRSAGLSETGVLLEYMLPLSSKRIDAFLLGRDSTESAHGVAIELKQWDRVREVDVDGCLVAQGSNVVLHPRCQVCHYTDYLRDFNELVQMDRLEIEGAAFLHNATTRGASPLRVDELGDACTCALFFGDQATAFQRFLKERLAGGSSPSLIHDFLGARNRPSKRLLDHLVEEIEGSPAFTLLDEQLVAFEMVKRALDEADRVGTKSVIVVAGGPGTGKSVIAARLLGHFAKRGYNVSHATGSKSFTETIRKRVGPRAAKLFRYFNSFGSAEQDELDVLICDEAHRIRVSSNDRFTPKARRSELPQVHELIQVSRVTVFLLDQNQVVRPQEIGTISSIKAAAASFGVDAKVIDLNGQFRCMGSDGYIAWVERLLGLREGDVEPWSNDGSGFEVLVAESPADMEDRLSEKIDEGWNARMAAGFCWPWSDPLPDGTLVEDVIVDGWRRPWNAKHGKKVKDAPMASYWASEPGGFNQVGCIYTAQGFEYDFGGVIFGPDLVRRNGAWQSNSGAHADAVVRKAPNFDALVRNIYKVLLTRGLRGCVLFSTDAETQDFLGELCERP